MQLCALNEETYFALNEIISARKVDELDMSSIISNLLYMCLPPMTSEHRHILRKFSTGFLGIIPEVSICRNSVL